MARKFFGKIDRELRFWFASAATIALGAFLILCALAGDTILERAHRYDELTEIKQAIQESQSKGAASGTPASEQVQDERFWSKLKDLFSTSIWHVVWHLLRDVGIALIVSVGVVLLLEKANRKVLEQEFKTRLEHLGTKTLSAVFENDHPQELFRNIRDTIFKAPLLRKQFDVTITLWKLDSVTHGLTAGAKAAFDRFIASQKMFGKDVAGLVAMQIDTKYRIHNVSAVERSFNPPFETEVYFPESPEQTCRVDSIVIGTDEKLGECKLERTRNALRCILPRPVELESKENRHVSFNGYAIRYINDSEIWCSALLTYGMSATLRDYTGQQLNLEIQCLCEPSDSKNNFDKREPEISLATDGCVLPYQSFVLIWGRGSSGQINPTPPHQVTERAVSVS